MTVKTDKKLWPLFILQILQDHADEGMERDEEGNKYLTRKQIIGFLRDEYGVETQVKAISENLLRLHEASLIHPELDFELDYLADERHMSDRIDSDDETQLVRKGWRLIKDYEFDPSEIRMLVDEVISSSVIPPTQTKQLIARLQDLSPYEIVVPDIEREGHLPVVNNDFFYNISLLNEAIQEKKLVYFISGSFGTDKKLHDEKSDGEIKEYTVIPIQLLISKGNYYLLAKLPYCEDILKFRLDLLRKLEKLEDKPADFVDSTKINVPQYREHHSYMMSGELMNVVLRVNKNSIHSIFDQFGPNVRFFNEHDDYVDVRIKSAKYSVLFWALQYYRYVEVIEPQVLRENLEVAGRVIAEMYAGVPGEVSFDKRQTESISDYKNYSD